MEDVVKAVQRKDVIIVIDVLRCCSTIVTALANGARGVIPTKTVKEARAIHEMRPEFILAGERKELKPKGFDLGNSPLEFSPNKVRGKHIILTTTSGTKAIVLSKSARCVLIGALLNVEAVAKLALKICEEEGTGISIVLLGRKGRFHLEDFICAGAIVESLSVDKVERSDAAVTASLVFQQVRNSLSRFIQGARHAQYLESIGLKDDVEFCSQMNVFRTVPFLNGDTVVPLNVDCQSLSH